MDSYLLAAEGKHFLVDLPGTLAAKKRQTSRCFALWFLGRGEQMRTRTGVGGDSFACSFLLMTVCFVVVLIGMLFCFFLLFLFLLLLL